MGHLQPNLNFKWARPLNLLRDSLPFFQCEEVHPFTVMIKKNTWHEKYITVILTRFPNARALQFNVHLQSHKIFSGRSFWNSAADKKGVSALNDRSHCPLKVHCILKHSSHPAHHLFECQPSGKHFRSIKACTARLISDASHWALLWNHPH